jgi:tetratricopeptide (TPR) repeat protein
MPKKPIIERPLPTTVSKQPAEITGTVTSEVTESSIEPQPLALEGQLPGEIVEETIEEDLLSLQNVNDRIFEYGRKLERWKVLDGQSATKPMNETQNAEMVRCFRQLQDVVKSYSELRAKMMLSENLSLGERITGKTIVELQKSDIDFLESSCARLLAAEDRSAGLSKREESADLSQLETLIDRYSANRQYEEVVQVWQKIPESQIRRVQLRTRILYGNGLMYLHQEEKAAEVYQQVVDQMSASDEQATDLVSLRKILADLYTASGNYKAAAVQYKKISDDYENIGHLEEWSKLQLSILDRSMGAGPELKEYSSLLRNYLGFIPEQDGYKVLWQADKFVEEYPYSPVLSNVDVIKERTRVAADKWFDAFMAGIENLITAKKFKEALERLETMPVDILGPDKQQVVKGKNEELLMAEEVDKEIDEMALAQELQNQWNKGLLLVKEEKYDEAIVVFTNLIDSEFSAKATVKVKEVSLEAANADRKKAAGLFMRYTKTTDIESRKKLLLESRRLLKNILVKYPDVEIGAKVIGNIEKVEQEMVAIDPAMLVFADQEDMPESEPGGVNRVSAPLSTSSDADERLPALKDEPILRIPQ